MIDFSIRNDSKRAGRLNFQIGHVFEEYDSYNNEVDESHIDLKDSIVIKEEAFSLVESCFASEFPVKDRHYIYYHHGENLHDIQSIKSIINKLNEKKSKLEQHGVNIEEYYWFEKEVIQYLNNNKTMIYKFIDNIINFLQLSIGEIECKAIYVIGI
ncbi:hypothetical protein [Psychrobacter sp. M13]|uniref:hypothetical protein n=1 Tax=Psychrobacter sp. M13 TaxID=3067275 RepID=UPI00273B6599|nr:hypothetical protein [Psychrobacter sp. M13]WLP94209.1 hypothetical protein Q9G97_11570 [Psychrobacter sp. M13]